MPLLNGWNSVWCLLRHAFFFVSHKFFLKKQVCGQTLILSAHRQIARRYLLTLIKECTKLQSLKLLL